MFAQKNVSRSGQQAGNYKIEELLVERTRSDLYLARDIKLDQQVFLEILRSTPEEDPDLAGRFQRRLDTISQIKHPLIAPIIDIGVTDDDYPYAVTEYIDGIWLSEKLETWREENYQLAVDSALLTARQIAEAMSAAHAVGLVHHDLRPENILLRESDNSLVFIDLGVPITIKSREAFFSETRSDMLDYASPEEIEGKTIGRRSNIYSIGIILYELLTGHRPKLPTSSWDIFERSTMPKEVPLEDERPGLSGETYRLVRNCLWRPEWSRFESADELISAIDTAILAEQSLPKATLWTQRRRRWLYVAVPVVALLVLVFGLLLVWGQFANAEPGQPTITPDRSAQTTPIPIAGGKKDTPTPAPTITLTREAPPTSDADSTVPIFGPPADQTFDQEETIRFAWIWLSLLEEGEEFAVYVVSEDENMSPLFVGTVNEPDNASLYVLESSPNELELKAGAYLWQVKLEKNDGGQEYESNLRRFIVNEIPTPTPTNTKIATPTEIPNTSTPTATATKVSPTPTEVVCEPFQPPGWIAHNVQPGENAFFYAQRANVPVARIFEANCLPNNSVLSVGQLLFIPPPLATNTPIPLPTVPTEPPFDNGGGNGGGNGGDNGGGESTPVVRPTSTPEPPPDE